MNPFQTGKKIFWTLFLALCLLLICGNVLLPVLAGNTDFQSGLQCLRTKQYMRALQYLDNCVDTEPTNSDFHFWRGRCLAYLNRAKDAVAEYRVAYLFAADQKQKAYCRQELARYKQPAPHSSVEETVVNVPPQTAVASASVSGPGPVNGSNTSSKTATAQNKQTTVVSTIGHKESFGSDTTPVKSGNLFKLSSKKLEWDLQMNSNFLQTMQAKNSDLARLASGTNWRLPAATAVSGRSPFGRRVMPSLDMPRGPAHATGALNQSEITSLLHSDIVIIIDHSGSMSTTDCPGASGAGVEPRLRWVQEELDNFASRIVYALPHGFTLITFDTKPDVYPIRSLSQFRNVLRDLQGDGGTDLPAALKEAFRVHTAHMDQPLLIAVVTDAEIDVQEAEETIIAATRRFPMPNGMFITLMQVGHMAEAQTADTLSLLSNLKTRAGLPYEPFLAIPFTRLRRDGIGRDILSAFSSASSASVSASATLASPKNSGAK